MTRRKIEIIVAVLILLILAFLAWFIFSNETETSTEEAVVSVEESETQVEDEIRAPSEPSPQPVARTFVERFGSFSSESDFKNVYDILPIVTESLASKLDDIVEKARATSTESYYGISTSVLTLSVVESSDSYASIEIMTQRKESIDSPANTSVRYQEITVDMIKEGESWLVDDFEWGTR